MYGTKYSCINNDAMTERKSSEAAYPVNDLLTEYNINLSFLDIFHLIYQLRSRPDIDCIRLSFRTISIQTSNFNKNHLSIVKSRETGISL